MECGEMGGTCCMDGEKMYVYKFWREQEGKKLLGKHRRRWDDNIRMRLKGADVAVWLGLMALSTVTSDRLL
jgi:hypothetical protein